MNPFLRYPKSTALFILITLMLGMVSACASGNVDESVQQTITARDAASTQTALTVTETAVVQSTTDAANANVAAATAASATIVAEQTAVAITNETAKNVEDAANNNATATAVSQSATRTAADSTTVQQTAVAIAATQTAAAATVPPQPTSAYLLNSTFPPVHGITTLSTGFTPDPHQVYAVAGGNADAGSRNLGHDCIGYVERAPDYRVHWTGNSGELTFEFIANAAGADTTLIVNDQNLTWFCNDDTDDLNPRVVIPNSVNGQYDIWLGSHNGVAYDGLLTVTELGGAQTILPTGGLSPMSAPNFGTIALATGFTPDPYVIDVVSGGSVDVVAQNIGNACTGFATEAPDFRLNWTGGSTELGIYFSSTMGEDPTLIISDAYGNWLCNDDYSTSDNSLDPAIFINAAPSGQYDIWIGSFSATDSIAGQLNIVER